MNGNRDRRTNRDAGSTTRARFRSQTGDEGTAPPRLEADGPSRAGIAAGLAIDIVERKATVLDDGVM